LVSIFRFQRARRPQKVSRPRARPQGQSPAVQRQAPPRLGLSLAVAARGQTRKPMVRKVREPRDRAVEQAVVVRVPRSEKYRPSTTRRCGFAQPIWSHFRNISSVQESVIAAEASSCPLGDATVPTHWGLCCAVPTCNRTWILHASCNGRNEQLGWP
jgi:hypothetical protein